MVPGKIITAHLLPDEKYTTFLSAADTVNGGGWDMDGGQFLKRWWKKA